MKSIRIIFLILLSTRICSLVLSLDFQRVCLKSLINYIKLHTTLYQAVSFFDKEKKNSLVECEIIKCIISNVATTNINNSSNSPFFQLPSIINPRPDTLFLIDSDNASFFEDIIDSLNTNMWSAHRQKILLVCISDLCEEKILPYAWSKNFVDVTLFQIKTNRSKFLFLPNIIYAASIHYFDFKDHGCQRAQCSNVVAWFPQKMKTLFGHRLKIDILNNPPFVNILRNESGHVVSKNGTSVEIFNYLERGLKFESEILPRPGETRSENARLELDDDTMLEDNFPEHDEDLRVNDRTLLKQTEVNAPYEMSAPIFHEEYCIVVPIIKKRSYGIASSIAFPMTCLGTIVLLKIFVTLALKFDTRFWKMTILTQILLGLTIHVHPKKSIERLVLAGLLIYAIVSSVFVYNTLSYMQMDYEKEVKFSALHELLEHKIKLQANRYDLVGSSKYLIITDTSGREHRVTFEHWDRRKFCLKSLVRLQNVGCYMSLVKAKLSVFNNNMKSGKKVAKIMDGCPRTFTSRLMLKKGSMYLRPVNNLLKNFIETGIPKKISELNMMNFVLHDRYLNANGEDEKLKDIPLNIYFWLKFASIGVAIASFVLYVELAQARREHRRKLLRAPNIK